MFKIIIGEVMDKTKVNERIQGFKTQVSFVGQMLGSYIEANLKDKDKIDKQFKMGLQFFDKIVKESIKQSVSEYMDRLKNDDEGLDDDFEVLKLRIKTLENFKGDLPRYQSPLASGFDVRAQLDKEVVLKPGQRELVPTGLSFEIPFGFELQARPRSGWAIKQGISLVNTPGTIDADYRGEVKIIIINHGQETVTIADQDRIAQLVMCPVEQPQFELVEELSDTERGAGGFGSTGLSEEKAVEEEDVEVEATDSAEKDSE